MAYHVTKDLKAEIKVGGSLFLKDLMGLILFPAIVFFAFFMFCPPCRILSMG